MTLTEAYNKAREDGHADEFAKAFHDAITKRMSEVDAMNLAISHVSSMPSKNEEMRSRMAYVQAFNEAIENGMDEGQARMIALQSVPRRT